MIYSGPPHHRRGRFVLPKHRRSTIQPLLLRPSEAARISGIDEKTLDSYFTPIKFGRRLIRYRYDEIKSYTNRRAEAREHYLPPPAETPESQLDESLKASQHLARKYHQPGWSRSIVIQRLIQHQGRCEICGREGELQEDHCHTTGIARGLICESCNQRLGVYEKQISSDDLRTYLLRYKVGEKRET